jgi:hypothetical protein
MLYQIRDRTRDETYTTENEPNARRFFATHRGKHPGHVVELWRQKIDGCWEKVQ